MPSSSDHSHSEVSTLAAGDFVGGGRYTLKSILGQGGMGVVWLARDERLHEDAALKFLSSAIRFDAVALDNMRRETLKSRRLAHPNIIRIHDLHQVPDEAPFISMEYVSGGNLSALRLQQPGKVFAWSYLAPLVKQLCEALDYAHAENVIHRDLKPANAMLDSRGRLKLADFGLSAIVYNSVHRPTGYHPTSGTEAYMSPQQMNGHIPQVTDDIYALGATLYELLAGSPPFYTGNIPHQVANKPAPSLEERLAEQKLTNDVPANVSAMIMACLSKDPTQRPQSAGAVARWIGLDVEHNASAAPSRNITITPPTVESEQHTEVIQDERNWVPMAAMFAALVCLGLGGWYWQQHRQKANPTPAKLIVSTAPAFPATSATAILWTANGHYYDFVRTNLTWHEAKMSAANRSHAGLAGHLATITSAAENEFIFTNFFTGATSEYAWLGGSEPQDNGEWIWSVGPETGKQFALKAAATAPFNYVNWGGVEPNDNKPQEDYLVMNIGVLSATIAPGKWADAAPTPSPVDPVVGFIVEYEPPGSWSRPQNVVK